MRRKQGSSGDSSLPDISSISGPNDAGHVYNNQSLTTKCFNLSVYMIVLYLVISDIIILQHYMGSADTWVRYQVRIPVGPDICHRGCAYSVLQTVQRPGVCSAAYGTVHYKEPLMSFEIRVGHSPSFGLPSVAILPWLCRKRRKTIFTHLPWSVYKYVIGRYDLNVEQMFY